MFGQNPFNMHNVKIQNIICLSGFFGGEGVFLFVSVSGSVHSYLREVQQILNLHTRSFLNCNICFYLVHWDTGFGFFSFVLYRNSQAALKGLAFSFVWFCFLLTEFYMFWSLWYCFVWFRTKQYEGITCVRPVIQKIKFLLKNIQIT